MRSKIAVIEDDELIRDMIRFHLEKNDFSVSGYGSAEAMMEEGVGEPFDLLILDLVLPGMSGQKFLKKLRQSGDDTPVLMLTVREDIDSRIASFGLGADDYMAKPFHMDELLARVKALIRRSQGKRSVPSSRILAINGRRIDLSTRVCSCQLGDIVLSEKEMKLLRYFLKRPNETLSRADILEDVWGMDVAPTPRTVDNFIMKFRRLFENDPDRPRIFVSVRGRGYRFHP